MFGNFLQGDDCSVFFLTIGFDKFDPIGFVKTPSPVTHLEWSPGTFVSILRNLFAPFSEDKFSANVKLFLI